MKAKDVTKDGYYWYRESDETEWETVEVYNTLSHGCLIKIGIDHPIFLANLIGYFSGPIEPPK